MSVDHYENFPVASWLCPPPMREAVAAIYHYARAADDLADEGDADGTARRSALALLRAQLHAAVGGELPAPGTDAHRLIAPLAAAVARHQLPLQPFDDLLDAFTQDTHQPHPADRADLLDYCRRSANPVGRLMLHLAGVHDPLALRRSDAVCTALQLINFWQDLSVDLPRGRLYLPLADLAAHGIDPQALLPPSAGLDEGRLAALVMDLAGWSRSLMGQGAPLALQVPGRLGWELRLVVQGGLRILAKITRMQGRTLHHRPTLTAADGPVLLWQALRMRSTVAQAAAPGPAPQAGADR